MPQGTCRYCGQPVNSQFPRPCPVNKDKSCMPWRPNAVRRLDPVVDPRKENHE